MAATISAQLSPGDLSKYHSDLEGTLNCTQCHILGEKVSDDKCLNCHKELKARIDRRKGYHFTPEVRTKNCASCHSDHHGRDFQIVRFDEKSFNHAKTGYELTGKHASIDCKQCHKPAFIQDGEIRKKKFTYLGLDQKCNSCHEDPHQNTLSKDCAGCHATSAFKPASNFKHDRSRFPLLGQHKSVDCKLCHDIESRAGKSFQKFTGLAFQSCSNCHTDPHKQNLGTACNQCHTEESFKKFSGGRSFNHGKTLFPLKGRHRSLDCAKCHQLHASPASVFQDRKGLKTEDCASCHKDVHEGKFGVNCKECHNEEGFRKVSGMDKFDHNLTAFKLEGRHAKVDCKNCHKARLTDPLPHGSCASCHKDYHEGQFRRPDASIPDCAQCHSVEGFASSSFSIEEHQKTGFPLEGAHGATPCSSCHLKEKKWTFKNIGKTCADCHHDVHEGYLDPKYYPEKNCKTCHLPESWNAVQFDHGLTGYILEGVHAKQDCMECHGLKPGESGNRYQKFKTLTGQCVECHTNVHDDQFAVNGLTDCRSCHDFQNWKPSRFDHDKTRFRLEGRHREIACSACHKPQLQGSRTFVQYKMENFECVVCHR